MSTVWIMIILLAAPPGESAAGTIVLSPAAATAEEPLVKPRTGAKLRDAAHETLRRWAKPNDRQAELAAREFLVLYDELRRDDQLPRTQREELSAKIRGRLSNLAQQIGRQAGGRGGMGAGGPAPAGRGYGTFGATQADDNGQQLVDLIQRTIAPRTWDVNGGPGSIYYWRPGRALAIRASQEVHEEVGGLLDQLQRAGP